MTRGLALLAVLGIALSVWRLSMSYHGLDVTETTVGTTPVTVLRRADVDTAPAVVIAHGFAGSRQLMQPFALTLARNGYVAVSFDFAGHGRNPHPLRGDITKESGATRALVAELGRVVAFTHDLDTSDGRVALLGHSMATDIVVRYAKTDPDVAATVAVSLFSPAVTAKAPKNLLVIVGGWEGGLKTEALRAVGLAIEDEAQDGVTYGNFDDGSARRVAFADDVEHIGVLYSKESMREALRWLSRVFDREGSGFLEVRGPWLGLLFLSLIILARPLSRLLPRVAREPQGAELPFRRFLLVALMPAMLTPLILWLVQLSFLPALVADYLVQHFALYGLLTGLGLWLAGGELPGANLSIGRPALAASAVAAYSILGLGLPLDRFVISFVPIPERWLLVLAMLAGTLLYFPADEWLTRGPAPNRGRYPLTKAAFVASLALAVTLDLERLFFLIIIVPVIVLFFIVYGLFSRWSWQQTQHPFVGGLANALAFAWAIAVTFPLVSG